MCRAGVFVSGSLTGGGALEPSDGGATAWGGAVGLGASVRAGTFVTSFNSSLTVTKNTALFLIKYRVTLFFLKSLLLFSIKKTTPSTRRITKAEER